MTNIRIDVSRIESDEEDRDGVSDEDLDLFRKCSSLPCPAYAFAPECLCLADRICMGRLAED